MTMAYVMADLLRKAEWVVEARGKITKEEALDELERAVEAVKFEQAAARARDAAA